MATLADKMKAAGYQPNSGKTLAQQMAAAGKVDFGKIDTQPATIGSVLKAENMKSQAERAANVRESLNAETRGEQGAARTIFQLGGQIVGSAVDPFANAAKAAYKKVVPEVVKKPLSAFGKLLSQNVGLAPQLQMAADKVTDVPAVQKFALSPKGAALERDVKAAVEYTNLIPAPKGAQALVRGTAKGTEAAAKALPEALKGTASAATKAAAKTAQKTGGTAASIASIASGVPKDVIKRAADPEFAPRIQRAIEHIAENEKQPYLDLATRAGEALNAAERRAAASLSAAKNSFRSEFPNATFDVTLKSTQIMDALKNFRSSGLILDTVMDKKTGRVTGYRVSRTTQSPFSDREITALNRLLDKIMASNKVNVDDLLALRQSFNAAYNDVPLGVNKEPTPYHAAVMAMKQDAEAAINDILPPELKSAFAEYRYLEEVKDSFGKKIVDADGNLKDGAEQFLANMVNTNKGAVRSNANEFERLTGLNVEAEVQAVKDAQKLVPLFPTTGSRTQDILRALAASYLGTQTMGPLGTATALVAISPRAVGKTALTVGNYLRRKPASKAKQSIAPVKSTPQSKPGTSPTERDDAPFPAAKSKPTPAPATMRPAVPSLPPKEVPQKFSDLVGAAKTLNLPNSESKYANALKAEMDAFLTSKGIEKERMGAVLIYGMDAQRAWRQYFTKKYGIEPPSPYPSMKEMRAFIEDNDLPEI